MASDGEKKDRTALEADPKYRRKDKAFVLFASIMIGQAIGRLVWDYHKANPTDTFLGFPAPAFQVILYLIWCVILAVGCLAWLRKGNFRHAISLGLALGWFVAMGTFIGWCQSHSCSIITGSPPFGTHINGASSSRDSSLSHSQRPSVPAGREETLGK